MQVRIIMEYTEGGLAEPRLRWERMATTNGLKVFPASLSSVDSPRESPGLRPAADDLATFELLGRAFEVAQREEEASFGDALAAFFRGALIRREDVMELLGRMEGR